MDGPTNLFVMLCGRKTAGQEQIIRNRAELDRREYIDVLTWFISESCYSGYSGLSLPGEFPAPTFVQDQPSDKSFEESFNSDAENTVKGGTYYFLTAQDPNDKTSVYDDSQAFARAILSQGKPTLFVIGGDYDKMKELRVEDVLPFCFLFGMGGPSWKRRNPMSQEAWIQRALQIASPKFMTGYAILILGHMYNQILSYRSGILTCRSNVNGIPTGETLTKY